MRTCLSALAFVAATLSYPAFAEEPNKDTGEASEAGESAKEAKEEKRICRRITVATGSRRKEKVCMTAEAWREFNNQR